VDFPCDIPEKREVLMTELPIAPVGRLIRQTGAERVSADAVSALTEILEEYGVKVAKEAQKLAIHSGRKTVTARDIREARDILS
jgi:histone H3/H4